MQSLTRPLLRLVFDSLLTPRSILPRNLLHHTSPRPSQCIQVIQLQCANAAQRRNFSSDGKQPPNPPRSPPTTSPSTSPTPSTPPSTLSTLLTTLQTHLSNTSTHLNNLTGYTPIEALKTRITALETASLASTTAARTSRSKHDALLTLRSTSQREVTALLARKDSWSAADLERFTSLYRSDHGNEVAVQEAAREVVEQEREAEVAGEAVRRAILERYHEEQVWSDKIRGVSTWGTLGLMGVNVVLFLGVQFGMEPWRRERLVRGFEERVKKALVAEEEKGLKEEEGKMGSLGTESLGSVSREGAAFDAMLATKSQESDANPIIDMSPPMDSRSEAMKDFSELPPIPPLSPTIATIPQTWTTSFNDLFSTRAITLKKQDITLIALEGAATGAALAGILVMFVLRPN